MAQIDIILPIIVGVLVGTVVSFLFVQYGSVNKYQATVFGINSNNLVTGITLFVIIGGIMGLAGMSAVIKDIDYIIDEPLKFIIETFIMGLLPTLALLLIIYFRTEKFTSQNKVDSLILFSKFAILHVLLQISGYYRYVFNE